MLAPLAITDTALQILVTGFVTIVVTAFGGLVTYMLARIKGKVDATAEKTDAISVKTDSQTVKLEGLEKKTDDTHRLLDGAKGVAMDLRVAELTLLVNATDDPKKKAIYRSTLDQAIIDAEKHRELMLKEVPE